MSVTSDSTSKNSTFLKYLSMRCRKKNVYHIQPTASKVACFCHILSLGFEAFMIALIPDQENIDSDLDSDDEETNNRKIEPNVVKRYI